jgi:nucleoside-diphosphate-sugar epimerase
MSRRTAILGGTGFIGLQLGARLADLAGSGDEIWLVDNFSRGRHDAEVDALLGKHSAVRLHQADLTDRTAFSDVTGVFDHVYLLASVIGVQRVESNPEIVFRTNTSIILNTLEWMAASGSRRLFFSSTSENYAGGYEFDLVPIPTPETVPLVISDISNPRFSYAITKIWGEAASIAYAKRYGFVMVIGRYHNVYGPRMGFDHVVPQLTQRIIEGETPLQVYGAEQSRAFCYVSDGVEATRLLMEAPIDRTTIVHIGNDREEVLMGDVARRLLALAGRENDYAERPAPRGSVPRRSPDLSRLRALTVFEPAVSLDRGLAETYRWYEKYFAAQVA